MARIPQTCIENQCFGLKPSDHHLPTSQDIIQIRAKIARKAHRKAVRKAVLPREWRNKKIVEWSGDIRTFCAEAVRALEGSRARQLGACGRLLFIVEGATIIASYDK